MIVVADGSSLDAWASELSWGQRAILERKQRSPRTYRYRSLRELEFELTMRLNTVYAAEGMAQGRAGFATFADSRCNERFWILTPEGGFRIRPDTTPSAGINDIYNNSGLYAFECAAAVVIVLYKAVLDTIGAPRFDYWFRNLYIYSWNYDRDLHLIQHTGGEAFPGDVRYVDNPDFDPSAGQYRGENLIVLMQEDTYFGHGFGIVSEASTIAALNRRRKPGATRSAYMTPEITHPDYAAIFAAIRTGPAFRRDHFLPFGEVAVRIGTLTHIR
jgi:protein-glutamine gamma-glutamyltransferase